MHDSAPATGNPKHRLPPAGGLIADSLGGFISQQFDDVFFSKTDGLAESRVVFLQSGAVVNAWQGKSGFTIGELGFGTGLNFLAAWHAWRATRAPGAILHFISIEGYLLSASNAAFALASWPELAPLAARLVAAWPHRAKGYQRLWFPDDGVCLTIIVGDVLASLQSLDAKIDTWFLDGFAPSRNPDMWSEAVFHQVARLCANGATFGTYTVAGSVRRGLEAAGFTLERHPGFGAKRERLRGIRAAPFPHATPSPFPRPNASTARTALVIGGGIAGACCVRSLARRGIAVTVIEDDPQAMAKASGNAAALLMPRLDRADTPTARFFIAAHLEALTLYGSLPRPCFNPIGVEERASSPEGRARLASLAADPPLPPELLVTKSDSQLLHQGSGIVVPAATLDVLFSDAAFSITATVASLTHTPMGWQAHSVAGDIIAAADLVFVASGTGIARLDQTRWLPLSASSGQTSIAQLQGPLPNHAIADGHYALPLAGGLMFGATFDKADITQPAPAATTDRHGRNQIGLASLDRDLADRIDHSHIDGRAALRTTTPDRLPIAGPALDLAAWCQAFGGLAEGRKIFNATQPHSVEGLHIVGGLGARGFSTAPLCAEIAVSTALGEPLPVERSVWEAVQPARFAIRSLKRGHKIGSVNRTENAAVTP